MIVDHGRFKDIAAGIQSLVTTLALGIAGLWVVFSFVSLKAQQKAAAEVASLELAAKQEPVLQVDLAASAPTTAASGPRRVSILAKLRNDGKRALEFSAPNLRIVSPGSPPNVATALINAEAEVIDPSGQRVKMPDRILRSGQARTIAFSVLLPQPGDYLMQLDVQYHGMDNVDGKLVVSNDEAIQALEQQIFSVR